MRYLIDIEDSSGNVLGGGPITTCTSWTSTREMDRAGTFSFRMAATDQRRTLVRAKRIARCWGIVGDEVREIGCGIIDRIAFAAGDAPELEVSGDDLLRELTYRNVGELELQEVTWEHAAEVYIVAGVTQTRLWRLCDMMVGDTVSSVEDIQLISDSSNQLYFSHPLPFYGVAFVISAAAGQHNGNPSVIKWQYYKDVDGWTDIPGTIIDTTILAGAPFGQSGSVTWEAPTDWSLLSQVYYVRCMCTSISMSDTDISDAALKFKKPTDEALDRILAYAPSGWSLDVINGYDSTIPINTIQDTLEAVTIVNADFETGSGDSFTGWTDISTPGYGPPIAAAVQHGGIRAVKFTGDAAFQSTAATVSPNSDYRIGYWTQGDGDVGMVAVQIQSGIADALGNYPYLSALNDSNVMAASWTYCTFDFHTPPGCTSIKVIIWGPLAPPGELDSYAVIDDISINRIRLHPGVMLQLAYETVLAALIRIAEATGEHFILSYSGHRILWLRKDERPCGLRAIAAGGVDVEANPDVALITNLMEEQDSFDLVTRIYPHGAGTGNSRPDLTYCSRTMPDGYVLSTANNYIERTASETALGARIDLLRDWPDVEYVDTSRTQQEYAANSLCDAAYEALRKQSCSSTDPLTGDVPRFYQLGITKCDRTIWPAHTIRVVYDVWRNGVHHYALDADLWITSVTTRADANGVSVVELGIGSVDRQPQTDWELLARALKDQQTRTRR